jgi:hypothetical protein
VPPVWIAYKKGETEGSLTSNPPQKFDLNLRSAQLLLLGYDQDMLSAFCMIVRLSWDLTQWCGLLLRPRFGSPLTVGSAQVRLLVSSQKTRPRIGEIVSYGIVGRSGSPVMPLDLALGFGAGELRFRRLSKWIQVARYAGWTHIIQG